MRKINFLAKLKKHGKLQLVVPSEEIKQSYISKSESNLASAKILLKNSRLEESVGLAYFSMYHMLSALFFRTGIKCENHGAAIIILKAVFDIDDKSISFAKKERIDKQYYTDFKIAKEDVLDTIEKAEEFNSKVNDFISRLENKEIELFRKRLLELS